MTADVETRTRLRCDEPGCKAHWPGVNDVPRASRGRIYGGHDFARTLAARAGWTYINAYVSGAGGDRCPEHGRSA